MFEYRDEMANPVLLPVPLVFADKEDGTYSGSYLVTQARTPKPDSRTPETKNEPKTETRQPKPTRDQP